MYEILLEDDNYNKLKFRFDDWEQMMIFVEYSLVHSVGEMKVSFVRAKKEDD